MQDIFGSIILGVIQGLTEFIPVSSSGHLILAREFLSLSDSHALAYDAVLQLATAGAVVLYFSRDLWRLFQAGLRMMGRLPVDEKDKTLLLGLLVGTIPAVIAGLLLEDVMETTFRSPLLVAVVLVLGSFLFMAAEYIGERKRAQKTLGISQSFIIGLFQVLALVPGMSRSGATISGGLILGLSRVEAARFSFLLSIPIIVGSGLKKLAELLSLPEGISLFSLLVGAGTAFFVGLFAIHFMLGYLRRHTLWSFVWYRIALATVVVAVVFFS